MLTTEEIVAEYRGPGGLKRLLNEGGWQHPFGVDEVHHDENGDDWYIIAAFTVSLDRWLMKQCDSNEEMCGHAPPHHKFDRYPRYNVHGSLLSLMTLRWL